jgi:hypothetical protein
MIHTPLLNQMLRLKFLFQALSLRNLLRVKADQAFPVTKIARTIMKKKPFPLYILKKSDLKIGVKLC